MIEFCYKWAAIRLLELINDKLSGNPCSVIMFKFLLKSIQDQIRWRVLTEKLAVKVDALSTTSKARVTCANCSKSNHSEDNCFKLKTCFKCKEKGHIARFCKADNAEHKTTSLKFSAAVQQIKVNISGLLKRGTGNGERGTGNGERGTGE